MTKEDSPEGEKPTEQMEKNVTNTNRDYTTIEIIGRLILTVIMKFWGLCTTGLVIVLLLFWLYGSAIALVLLTLGIIGVLYNCQDMLLYYPDQPPHARLYVESPGIFSLPYENIFIKSKDGTRINMYLIKQPAHAVHTAPTVIFLHGNAGNIGHRLLNVHALHSLTGTNILLLEYRGYGKSQGSPSEQGLYMDAQAAMDYLLSRSDIDHTKLIIYGRSLGGAVAINLASQAYYSRKAMAVIVENTFTNLPSIAQAVFDFRILHYIPIWMYKNKYPSVDLIMKIRLPMLFLSGQADNLIPPSMMQLLFEVCGSSMKRLARFDGGTHNETWQCPNYYETINRFIAEVVALEGSPVMNNTSLTYSVDIPFNDQGVYNI